MNILFSGVSSFSGFWFARRLAEAGHRVFCTFTKHVPDAYIGIRGERVALLMKTPNIIPLWSCAVSQVADFFPSAESLDGFCTHAAEVGDYKSGDFDPVHAVAENTRGIVELYRWLRSRGCDFILHSGTYFESGEGVGGVGQNTAFSPYAVSKTMTWELVRYYAECNGLRVGKFVMPNPFGTFEERGFVTYLAKTWLAGSVPVVKTPKYVRDNLPIDKMAAAYADAVAVLAGESDAVMRKFLPSGFVGEQGDFARLVAARLSAIWQRECPLEFAEQTIFAEPVIRKNSAHGISDSADLDTFWLALADFYQRIFGTSFLHSSIN